MLMWNYFIRDNIVILIECNFKCRRIHIVFVISQIIDNNFSTAIRAEHETGRQHAVRSVTRIERDLQPKAGGPFVSRGIL